MPNYTPDDPEYWQLPEGYAEALAASGVRDIRLSHFFLGPDTADTPKIVVLDMEPGFVLPRHAHGCERFEVIVRGSLWLGEQELPAGTIMTARAGEFYGP